MGGGFSSVLCGMSKHAFWVIKSIYLTQKASAQCTELPSWLEMNIWKNLWKIPLIALMVCKGMAAPTSFLQIQS